MVGAAHGANAGVARVCSDAVDRDRAALAFWVVRGKWKSWERPRAVAIALSVAVACVPFVPVVSFAYEAVVAEPVEHEPVLAVLAESVCHAAGEPWAVSFCEHIGWGGSVPSEPVEGWVAAAPDPPPSAKASDRQIIAHTAVDPAIEAEVRELRTEVNAMVVLLGQKDEVCSCSPGPGSSAAHRAVLFVVLEALEVRMKKAQYNSTTPVAKRPWLGYDGVGVQELGRFSTELSTATQERDRMRMALRDAEVEVHRQATRSTAMVEVPPHPHPPP